MTGEAVNDDALANIQVEVGAARLCYCCPSCRSSCCRR